MDRLRNLASGAAVLALVVVTVVGVDRVRRDLPRAEVSVVQQSFQTPDSLALIGIPPGVAAPSELSDPSARLRPRVGSSGPSRARIGGQSMTDTGVSGYLAAGTTTVPSGAVSIPLSLLRTGDGIEIDALSTASALPGRPKSAVAMPVSLI